MDKLEDKLLKLKETLEKAMNNGGLGGPGSVKLGAVLPSLKAVTSAGKPAGNNSATPSTGIKQPSKKNPIKSAQQTQNKDIKDVKMKEAQAAMSAKAPEMIKFEKNGQWSIEKADDYKQRETAVPGVSDMGIEARRGSGKSWRETGYMPSTDVKTHKENARAIARHNLKETKKIKPKLVKSDTVATMSYDDSSDKVINGATVNHAQHKGTDINVANKTPAAVNKSGYKGYTEADNARRKKNNLSEDTGIHSMNRIKQYGGSGPNAAAKEAAEMKRKSKKNPVKTYTKEEIAAYEAKKSDVQVAPEGSPNRESYQKEFEGKNAKK